VAPKFVMALFDRAVIALLRGAVKLEFHDADTDTDTEILARILADTPDTRD